MQWKCSKGKQNRVWHIVSSGNKYTSNYYNANSIVTSILCLKSNHIGTWKCSRGCFTVITVRGCTGHHWLVPCFANLLPAGRYSVSCLLCSHISQPAGGPPGKCPGKTSVSEGCDTIARALKKDVLQVLLYEPQTCNHSPASACCMLGLQHYMRHHVQFILF